MNPNELFFNSTTNVVFAHDINWQWPEDIRQISRQEASDYVRDGATLDSSVKDAMGIDIVASAPAATVGNVSAVAAATSAASLPESTNNPTTEDTKIPTTDTPVSTLDTPLDSSSSLSAGSASDSSSAGSSVLSSGSEANAEGNVGSGTVIADSASDASNSASDFASIRSDSQTSAAGTSGSNSSPSEIGELPGEGVVSPAASSPASGTASSASNALPVEGTADTAADSSLLAAGKVDAAVIPAPVVASTSGGVVGGLLPTAPLPVVESGNVPAGGVLPAGTTSQATDDEDRHPSVPHLRALRNKIESGEAIIMADLLNLLHRIEESL